MQLVIGKVIRQLRCARGLTQKDMACALGVTEQAISRWETETTCPDISLIVPLADYFGITVGALFGTEPVLNLKNDAKAHAMQKETESLR